MTGNDLKRNISKLGVTQRKLSELMGVKPQTINAILGAKDVRTSTIERIAAALGLPITYFYDGAKGDKAIASGDTAVAVNTNTGSIHIHAASGDTAVAVNTNTGSIHIHAANGGAAVLEERVKALEQVLKEQEKLLAEKERLIKVLLDERQ